VTTASRASSAETGLFAAFCAAGLWPGLGRTTAGRLGAAGITRPADVTIAKLCDVQGVAPMRADRLVGAFRERSVTYDVAGLLYEAELPLRPAAAAAAALGSNAVAILREDPWRLLDGGEADLAAADRLAASLGVPRDAPGRGPAVVVDLLERAARAGDTAADLPVLLQAVARQQVSSPADALRVAAESGRVDIETVEVPDGEDAQEAEPTSVALERLAVAEAAVAEGLVRLIATVESVSTDDTDDTDDISVDPDSGLDEQQAAAAALALTAGVSVLTGGPGTGKSRTVAAIVALARAAKLRVALAAPTGRAAKRLEELVDAPASTLHRLLGAQGTRQTGGTFTRGEEWPLDADLVVVDEASMLDVELAAALVEACSDGTRLVFVGDPAQLPSVGPGRVLADLVDAGIVPVTELRRLYRHDEGGAIAALGSAIRQGTLPPPPDAGHEVVVVPARSSAEAAHRVRQLVTDSIPRALGIPSGEVQVVTPVHRGDAGTDALNAALKALLNPGPGAVSGFDVGDRVLAIANRYPPDGSPGFANGEVGVVTATAAEGGLTVEFPGGPVTVPPGALGDLRHGWAITVHRAQGSEWPAVVAVLPPESGGMLTRPLVYTAVTRAQRHLSIVPAVGGQLPRAVRDERGRPRRTRLRRLLTEAAEGVLT
jgi:exodeoxyribonuclease V alpha subunit